MSNVLTSRSSLGGHNTGTGATPETRVAAGVAASGVPMLLNHNMLSDIFLPAAIPAFAGKFIASGVNWLAV
jgi:hypothetical protein